MLVHFLSNINLNSKAIAVSQITFCIFPFRSSSISSDLKSKYEVVDFTFHFICMLYYFLLLLFHCTTSQ